MARPLAQRLAALTVVAALMAGLSVPAFAATYNIGDGSITIEANGDGTAKVTQNETVNEKDDDVIVKGSGETTSNVIEVINNTEDDLKITLSDVDIADTKGKAPLSVSGTGDTTIELDGNNSLTGSGWSAGLERNEEKDAAGNVVSGKLTIQDENKTAVWKPPAITEVQASAEETSKIPVRSRSPAAPSQPLVRWTVQALAAAAAAATAR